MRRQRRRRQRMGMAGPASTAEPAPPARHPLRVLVVAHVFHPEIWPELAECIAQIREPRDVCVTLVEGPAGHLREGILDRFPEATVLTVPNRGRDQWPLLDLIQDARLLEGVDVVLKLHTKASRHRLDGRRWRRRMLASLSGSRSRVDEILALFGADPMLGIVAPTGGLLGREFWGGNTGLVQDLAARLGVPVDLERTFFPGGSMYWARTGVLRALGALDLVEQDFPAEPLPSDGTLAHALERLVGVVATAQGLEVIAADEVSARLARIRSTRQPGDDDGR